MTAAHRPVRAAILSSAARLSATNAGLQQEVLGRVAGDGQLGEDERGRRPPPRPRRARRGSRLTLPSRSPTTVFSWAIATRMRAMASAYRGATLAPMVDRRRSRPAVDDARRRSSDRPIRWPCGSRSTASTPLIPRSRIASRRTRACATRSSRCAARAARSRCSSKSTPERSTSSRDLDARPRARRVEPRCAQALEGPRVPAHRGARPAGSDELEVTVAAIAALGRDVLRGAASLVDTPEPLAVIGMGKLGGDELNYASDIDVMFVGDGDGHAAAQRARALLEIARRCFRVDVNLRPQGRDGPLVRTLASYEAYWERWAEPWEFQALLKARAVAGDRRARRAVRRGTASHLWRHVFTADDLRAMRTMKARVEQEMVRKGLERPRGEAGPRRHPRHRVRGAAAAARARRARRRRCAAPTRWSRSREMAAGGYVDQDDAAALADAYCFLRRVEHRLQLVDEQQVHAIPDAPDAQARLARTLGYRDTGEPTPSTTSSPTSARHQATVRAIHERLYFRPLLEAFAALPLLTRPGATEARLAAFGFTSPDRARVAVRELTSGLTRSSRLMQQMLPLLLDWLADSPDPDLGLLSLRKLASGSQRSTELASLFRDSPEAARRVCALVGTSRHGRGRRAAQPRPRRAPARLRAAAHAAEAGAGRERAARRSRGATTSRSARPACGGGRSAISSASSRATCSARPMSRPSGRDVSALAEATLEVALEALDAVVAVRRDRPRSLRRRRAVVRERPRRPLRLRRADARGLRGGREARDRGPPLRGRCDPGGAALGGRRRPASRGQAGSVGAQRRGLRDLLRPLGAGVGATGDDPGPAGRR